MISRFVLSLLTFLSLSATALAQDPPRRAHVTELPPIIIEGARQLPVQILLTRHRVDFSPPELQTSFVREIVRTPSH